VTSMMFKRCKVWDGERNLEGRLAGEKGIKDSTGTSLGGFRGRKKKAT